MKKVHRLFFKHPLTYSSPSKQLTDSTEHATEMKPGDDKGFSQLCEREKCVKNYVQEKEVFRYNYARLNVFRYYEMRWKWGWRRSLRLMWVAAAANNLFFLMKNVSNFQDT